MDNKEKPMRVRTIAVAVAALAAVAGLSGCIKRLKAPDEAGTCYMIGHPKAGEVKFNVISKGEPDLEHCAVRLYNLRMDFLRTGTAGDVTEGAYSGSFLFVDNHEVRFSQHYESPSFPLLVKAPDGRLVQPGSIVEEDDTPTGKPESVTIPKDLPKKP